MTKTREQLVTPFGRAGFCFLIRPNYKFQKEKGEFSASVILSASDAAGIVGTLDALYEQAQVDMLAEAQAELDLKAAKSGKQARKLEPLKRADKPFKQVVDPDTGDALPEFKINARLKHKVIGKDDTGADVVFRTVRPIVVDAKKRPVLQEVGAGSTIRISFIANPFYTPAVGAGLSLRLVGVQVKELVQIGMVSPDFDEVDGFEETTGATASDPIAPATEPALTEDDVEADY
jgi:hypothetical protein